MNQRHLFVHIGDTHICPGPRLADRLSALNQIIVWAEAASKVGELAAILWPGDLFDKTSTVEDRNLLQPIVKRLANLAPLVLCDGNHDKPGDLLYLTETRARYEVTLARTPKVVTITCATGIEAAIFCLPYPHKGGLVGAGVEHDALGQTARSLLDPVFVAAAEELRQARDRGAIPMFMGHVNVGGSVSSTGQPQIGRELELDPGLLARLDAAVYRGLNHIHKSQVVAGDTVYAGSICRMDFGENEPKGFVVVSASPTEATWAFEPLDVPEQLIIAGRLTREGFQFDHDDFECEACAGDGDGETSPEGDTLPCVHCNGSGRRSWSRADIKVSVRYKQGEVGALDWAHVHAEFAGCRSLKLDPIAEFEHTVRAPEVAAAVTLEAKAEAYCDHRQIPWSASLAAKLTDLQQQEPEAILASVEQMAREAGQVPADDARKAVA